MRELYLGALALLLAFGLGAAGMYALVNPRLAAERAKSASLVRAADALMAQRKVDQATLASLAKKNAVAARESASTRVRLQAAAASAAEWRDQPVPQEVQDALK